MGIYLCEKMTDALSSLGNILVIVEVDFFFLEGADASVGVSVLPRTPAASY